MIPKFRAWITERFIMEQVAAMIYEEGEFNRVLFFRDDLNQGCNTCWCKWWYVHKSNLMQFTGAKDMHGTSIYEGDIIRKEECAPDDMAFGHYGSIGTIRYVVDTMGFVIDSEDDGFYDNMGMNFSFNEIEVIGNVYENPEIIEVSLK